MRFWTSSRRSICTRALREQDGKSVWPRLGRVLVRQYILLFGMTRGLSLSDGHCMEHDQPMLCPSAQICGVSHCAVHVCKTCATSLMYNCDLSCVSVITCPDFVLKHVVDDS